MGSKEVDVTIKGLWHVSLGKLDFWLTTTHISYIIVFAILIGFAIYVRYKSKKFGMVPKGFQNIVEFLVDTLDSFTKSVLGKRAPGFMNYIGTLFAFILIANLSGLIGLRPPTADFATTFGLAVITFFMIQINNIRFNGFGGYVKGFFTPVLLTPLNIIGEISTPVSMSLRLFCNILGGMILMNLVYTMVPVFLAIGIPAALHGYLDIFSGVLQAFIFSMLTMVFVSNAIGEEA